MLNLFYKIFILLLAISFIVTIHELGHYLIGRLLNTKIREFSIGVLSVKFLPKFVDSRKTIWRIGLLPIGGYVAFVLKEEGQNNPVEDGLEKEIEDEQSIWASIRSIRLIRILISFGRIAKNFIYSLIDNTNYSVKYIKGKYFEEIGSIGKMVLAAAGPIMNFVLAFVLFGTVYIFSGRTNRDLYFSEAGANHTTQDKILTINGKNPVTLRGAFNIERPGVNVVELLRGQKTVQISFTKLPKMIEITNLRKLSFFQSISFASKDLIDFISLNLTGIFGIFKSLFHPNTKGIEKLGGIIAIVKSGFADLDKGIFAFLEWVALTSISVGVMNLLPLPPFDGSLVLLAFLEMILGRKQKLQTIFGYISMMVIVFFAVVTLRNDIFLKRNRQISETDMRSFKDSLNRKIDSAEEGR